MNIDQIRDYCLSKKGTTEGFPFDQNALVFKVLDKMFALTALKNWEAGTPYINLKCDPDYAQELRAQYESIEPGYHASKKHWNTIRIFKNELPPKLLFKLIDHSYDMVVKGMSKKMKATLV